MRIASRMLLFTLLVACNAMEEDVGEVTQLDCNCDIYPAPCCCDTPVVLDLAGDGVEFTTPRDGVSFELAPGKIGPWAWTEPGSDDAWLVRDMTEDGIVNNGYEMFSASMPQPQPAVGKERHGFAALAAFDRDRNGIVNARDDVWREIRLWQDRNHDAISQPEELLTLGSVGIASLSVKYTQIREPDGKGNVLRYSAAVQTAPGSTVSMTAYDVLLASATPQERAELGLPDTLPQAVQRIVPPAADAASGPGTDASLLACVFSLRAPAPYRFEPIDMGLEVDFKGGWDGNDQCPPWKRLRGTLYQKKGSTWYSMSSQELNVNKNTEHVLGGRGCADLDSHQWKSTVTMTDNGASKTSTVVPLACDGFATAPPGCGGN